MVNSHHRPQHTPTISHAEALLVGYGHMLSLRQALPTATFVGCSRASPCGSQPQRRMVHWTCHLQQHGNNDDDLRRHETLKLWKRPPLSSKSFLWQIFIWIGDHPSSRYLRFWVARRVRSKSRKQQVGSCKHRKEDVASSKRHGTETSEQYQ